MRRTPTTPEPLESRLLFAAGDPDTAYGAGGQASLSLAADGITGNLKVTASLTDSADGGTLIVGDGDTAAGHDLVVIRLTPDGRRDPSFGPTGDGVLVLDATGGFAEHAVSVALDAGRNIVIAGYADDPPSPSNPFPTPTQEDILVVRVKPNGQPDSGFSGSGTALLPLARADGTDAEERANALSVNADGSVIVAGQTDFAGTNQFILARFTSAGNFDPSFGTVGPGVVATQFQSNADESARAVFTYTSGPDAGKILVVGDSRTAGPTGDVDQKFVVARYNPDGMLDTTFGDLGRSGAPTGKIVGTYRTHAAAGSIDHAGAVTVDPFGRVVVGGFAADVTGSLALNTASFAVARFTSVGQPDTAAGKSTIVTDLGGFSAITDLVAQGSGKIVAGGRTAATAADVTGGNLGVAVVRYGVTPTPTPTPTPTTTPLPDALALDPTFSGDGILLFDPSGNAVASSGATSTSVVGPSALRPARLHPAARLSPAATPADQLDIFIDQAQGILTRTPGFGLDIGQAVGTTVRVSRAQGAGAPTVRLLEHFLATGNAGLNVEILLTNDENVDPASLGSGNIKVQRPGAPTAEAVTFVSARRADEPPPGDPIGAGYPVVAVTYLLAPRTPGGTFTSPADDGQYSTVVQANQIKGTDGQSSDDGPLQPFTLDLSDGGGGPTGTLTPAFRSAVPAAVVGGVKGKTKVTVGVINTAPALTTVTTTVRLFVSADQSLDPGVDKALASITKKLKLKPSGGSKSLKLKVPAFPGDVPDGSYFVIADATDAEGNHATSVAPAPVTIAAPFARLGANLPGPLAGALRPGGKASASFVLSNAQSNVVAAGSGTVTLAASPDATAGNGDDVPIFGPVTQKVSLKSGKSKTYKLKFTLPPTLAPGTYHLVATFNRGAGLPADPDLSDDTAISAGTFTVIGT